MAKIKIFNLDIIKNDSLWNQIAINESIENKFQLYNEMIPAISQITGISRRIVINRINKDIDSWINLLWESYQNRNRLIDSILDNGYKIGEIGFTPNNNWNLVLDNLPRGSGINYDYYISVINGLLICDNKYDIMLNGYYDSVMGFTVKYDVENKLIDIESEDMSPYYSDIDQIIKDNNIDPSNESQIEFLLSDMDLLDEFYIETLIDYLYSCYEDLF